MSVKSFTFKGSLGSVKSITSLIFEGSLGLVKSTDSVATPIGSGLSSFFFLNQQVCHQEILVLFYNSYNQQLAIDRVNKKEHHPYEYL